MVIPGETSILVREPVARWLTISEFLAENRGRISRKRLYELIKSRAVPYCRLGKILIPSDLLDRMAMPVGESGKQADSEGEITKHAAP